MSKHPDDRSGELGQAMTAHADICSRLNTLALINSDDAATSQALTEAASLILLAAAPVEQEPVNDSYYLQDSRSMVGNDVLFWAKRDLGYTTDLRNAQVFTKSQAEAHHKSRSTDLPWPKSYIDGKSRPSVDFQSINRAESTHPSPPADKQAAQEGEAVRPKRVVICGSSRFVDIMSVCCWLLERDEGAIAMALHLLPHWYGAGYGGCPDDHLAEHEGIAPAMDELHLRKIDLADEIFVVNRDDYIGDSTRREIEYATKLGKPIRWYNSNPNAIKDQVEAMLSEAIRAEALKASNAAKGI